MLRSLSADAISKCLARYASEYQRQLLAMIAREPYEETLDSGLALLALLSSCDVRIGEYSSVFDGDAGAPEEVSAVIACAFSNISADPSWWEEAHLQHGGNPDRDLVARWKARFRSYSDVVVLDGWTID